MKVDVKFAENECTFPVNIADAGYDAGYNKAEDDFWDSFQDYGDRTFYEYAFRDAGFEYIRPKYKIKPTSRGLSMFQSCQKLKAIEKEYIDLSGCAVTSQSANVGGWYSTFYLCYELEIIEDVGMAAGGYYMTYNNCRKLHTIEAMRVLETTKFETPFTNCRELQNLTIEGTIGQNSFNVSPCTKLTHDSLMSIINALKDYSGSGTTWTVTLGRANIAKLTDEEQFIAYAKGWVLA